jgi:signal peptidase II
MMHESMKPYSKLMTIMTVLVLCVGCDQIFKQVARVFLSASPPLSFVGDFIRLQYAENSGIMLSIGAELSHEVRFWIFTVGVGVMLILMLVYIFRVRVMERAEAIAWSLVLSGGLGNLIDRVMRDGVVIDYVSVGIGVIRTAVFNLADALVFAGVIFLLVQRRNRDKAAEKMKDQVSNIKDQK